MKSYTDLHYPTVIAASASMPGFVNTSTMCQAYSLQYIADAPKFSGYLPAVQKMIDSLQITSQLVPIPSPAPGREIVIGPNGTATIRGFNGWATFRGPPGSILHNFSIVPEPNNTSK